MSNVLTMDLLSRPGKAIIRRGAVQVADVPEGYNNFVCYMGDIVIVGANVPPMILNTETNRFEALPLRDADSVQHYMENQNELIVIEGADAG